MKIVEAETALEVFRETCPHPTLTYVNKGYSGNWDNDEYYWREWKCHDCGKRWQTDQSYETQKQYPQAIDVSRLDYEGKHLLKKLRGIDLE
jgi:transposase-like protein